MKSLCFHTRWFPVSAHYTCFNITILVLNRMCSIVSLYQLTSQLNSNCNILPPTSINYESILINTWWFLSFRLSNWNLGFSLTDIINLSIFNGWCKKYFKILWDIANKFPLSSFTKFLRGWYRHFNSLLLVIPSRIFFMNLLFKYHIFQISFVFLWNIYISSIQLFWL
jgi:hypothetical protein